MANRTFVEKWVFNERTGSVNREVDEVRSAYPPLANSGFYHWDTSQVYTMLLSVPSTKIFRLKRMIVYNGQVLNELVFYDGPGTSVTAFIMDLVPSQTEFINGLDVPFQSHVCASNLDSQVFCRVQGILVTSE
jgi:hypothetical protein